MRVYNKLFLLVAMFASMALLVLCWLLRPGAFWVELLLLLACLMVVFSICEDISPGSPERFFKALAKLLSLRYWREQ